MTQTFEAMHLLSDAKNNGINYADIARHMDVSAPTVSRWLNGAGVPSSAQMRKLRRIVASGWSVVKLSSPETLQVFHVVTADPDALLARLLRSSDKSPEAIFCRKVRNTVRVEVLLHKGKRPQANAVKRALDKEARKPQLLRSRAGRSHPSPVLAEAAPDPSTPLGAASIPQ